MKSDQLFNALAGAVVAIGMTACGASGEKKSYNEGVNVIPAPASLTVGNGEFSLKGSTKIGAAAPEAKKVAEYFVEKMERSTGYDLDVEDNGDIRLTLDPQMEMNSEGYRLEVGENGVDVTAKTPQGLFYGMQSFMQLLPAEIESSEEVDGIEWSAPYVSITDEPRFAYRGIHFDPCRHFMTVDEVKKQLDVMAMYKINRMHWHLTEDQGWRIEIKKYPKLTEIGSKRIEGEGHEYGGYYTQEEVKEIVEYAAERFITVVPEIEMPGHEMAAIAAYPELSCKGEQGVVRNIWGVEDIVLCAGKESTFEFFENVLKEVMELFPSEYIHIGGDECPKTSWADCPLCQKRIREEKLFADKNHSAEEKLQSYFIQRIEKFLAQYGRKIIGWDEILEGGLAPTATVMSWRGEKGGIASAMMNHNVIMTPGKNGLYLDFYQGDKKIEPVSIGGYTSLKKIYDYNPTPDTLVAIGKDHFVMGVQANVWSEYLYTNEVREYQTYPRALALAEVAWTKTDRKDYADFERRINNAYVRLDGHGINYHIPLPEQPNGSCNTVAFMDTVSVAFKTSRPVKMVYTLDGSEPTAASAEYTEPLAFSENGTIKIASVLPSGKMSRVRTIGVVKQEAAPAVKVDGAKPGLNMNVTYGTYLNVDELKASGKKPEKTQVIKETKEMVTVEPSSSSMRGVKQFASVAEGYIEIPETGVYYISSELEEVWLDGKLLVNNRGEVKRHSRTDTSVALEKGLHPVKLVFLGHIIGGWPSNWGDGSLRLRNAGEESFKNVTGDMLFYK